MKTMEAIGPFLLSAWLLLWAGLRIFGIGLGQWAIAFDILALLAGLFLLFSLTSKSVLINMSMLLLSVWLMLTGGLSLAGINPPLAEIMINALGLVAGVGLLFSIAQERTLYHLGLFILGIWLIGWHLLLLFGIVLPLQNFIFPGILVVAVLLILMGL